MKREKKADTIKFIREVAADVRGIALTNAQADRAYKELKKRANPGSADFYYATKEYFVG